MGETEEWIERQLRELQVLSAAYPEGFELGAQLQSLIDHLDQGQPVSLIAPLTASVQVPDTEYDGSPVTLSFVLPLGYPFTEKGCLGAEAPTVSVVWGAASREMHAKIREAASSVLASDCECLLEAVQVVQDCATDLRAVSTHLNAPEENSAASGGRDSSHDEVKRVVIWFHHIKSVQKRKNLVGFARELDLRGMSKPGFPGVVIAEGYSDQIDEYVRRVAAMRWQAMQIRADEVDIAHRLPAQSFVELPENGLSTMGQACKSADIEHLFRSALKLQ